MIKFDMNNDKSSYKINHPCSLCPCESIIVQHITLHFDIDWGMFVKHIHIYARHTRTMYPHRAITTLISTHIS